MAIVACPACGEEDDLRGDQWAPSGIRVAWYCWSCTGVDVTSARSVPGPNPPPGNAKDLRSLRPD